MCRFSFAEDLGGMTPIKSSVQRSLRSKLVEWYPGIESELEEIIPKKANLMQVKT